jgi:hypothetical protein
LAWRSAFLMYSSSPIFDQINYITSLNLVFYIARCGRAQGRTRRTIDGRLRSVLGTLFTAVGFSRHRLRRRVTYRTSQTSRTALQRLRARREPGFSRATKFLDRLATCIQVLGSEYGLLDESRSSRETPTLTIRPNAGMTAQSGRADSDLRSVDYTQSKSVCG